MQENIIQVQDQPYVKFNNERFYKKNNITSIENPFDVTLDQAKEELRKIKSVENGFGFAYFFLEYCVVSHPTLGKVKIKDEIYKWQAHAAEMFVKSRYIVSLKSRQVAFSTTVGAYCLWRALFFDSQRIAIVSKNQPDSITFLERVKFMYDKLPPWIKQKTSEFAKTYVAFEHNFSKITSLPNRGDPAQGESLSLLVLDEFASYQDQEAVLSAATPALSAGSLTPFTNNTLPSQLFVISTLPRKNVVNNEYLRILHGAQDNLDSRYKLIDVEVDDISYYRDKQWHQEQLETLGRRGYQIEILKQEVYETEHALISGEILKDIKTEHPIRVDFFNKEDVNTEGYYKDLNVFAKMKNNWDPEYKYLQGLWIFREPNPGKEYVIVSDVAGGESNDKSTFHVFDPEENLQVAEYQGNVNTEQFKEVLEAICEFYNGAKLSVERNGLGINICQYFGNVINYEKFYWHKYTKNKVLPGFPMVNPIRPNSIAFLENYLTKGELQILSIRTVNELRNFGMTSRGRIAALAGNDDLVMALCQYVWLQENGFAVSDKMAMDEMFGDMDEVEKEMKEIPKYWQDDFDLEMDEQQREILNWAKATGTFVDAKVLRRK